MLDQYEREINYLRISLTDKCNLRCRYCLPNGVKLVLMEDLLTMEEIAAIARCGAKLGIDRVKLTGGEPLVRRGILQLMEMLQEIDGLKQITMTTNGLLLRKYLPELTVRGLSAVNISLDTMDPETYRQITGFDGAAEVLAAVDAALDEGLKVKINSVLMEDLNPGAWKELIMLAKNRPLDVRFIELMPIGEGTRFHGVSNVQLLKELKAAYPDMEPDRSIHGNGPAVYYHIPGFEGSIGLISAVHHKFCSGCNRIRLTADGQLKPCLCYDTSADLKTILRTQGENAVLETMRQTIYQKPEEHCFEEAGQITEHHRMASIGG